MPFEAKFQNGKLWRGRWEQPKEEFIREPDKFCLGGKKNLLWVSATSKNHWLMLSQAAVTCSGRSSSTRELQTSSFPLKDVQRWERARYPRAHGMPIPPHHLFPTPTHTPCLSNRSTLWSCWFLIPPDPKCHQIFACNHRLLDLCHSNKKANPGFFTQMRCSTKALVLGAGPT